jgi:indolepyruvate decarboxylase
MRLAPYLFQRLFDLGAAHAFGIPGDHVLPLYEALGDSPIRSILTTHEPSAGFAADAYARLKGIGVAIGTYGAGVLNMVNPIAQAYAEKSPVVVISGAPDKAGRDPDLLIHHKVKTFDTQLRVYEEMTAASAALEDPRTAAREIERVIEAVQREKRPGYLEIPRDMARAEIDEAEAWTPHGPVAPGMQRVAPQRDPAASAEAMQEIATRLNRSRSPVILAGIDIMRLGLRDNVIRLAERYNLPVATSFMGKAVFPEHHPNFIGTYMGAASHPYARRMVEESDCLLLLGVWLTDTETGRFTSLIARGTLIQALANEVVISRHRYQRIGLTEILAALLESSEIKPREFRNDYRPEPPEMDSHSMVAAVFSELSRLDDTRYIFTTDTGDCLFGAVALHAETILNPGYYTSMGFGVPAALGAGLAAPDRRPIALVGDGGFQMTGMEIGTLVRYGVNAVVIVLNNGGYRSLEALGGTRTVWDIHPWDYVAIARALGAEGTRVRTAAQFQTALSDACKRQGVSLIEVMLAADDLSVTLRRLGRRLS